MIPWVKQQYLQQAHVMFSSAIGSQHHPHPFFSPGV
jgi:hypothetical protein